MFPNPIDPFVKIDTQGFEKQVLDGFVKSISKVRAIMLELSLTPLYKEQELWLYFIERTCNRGVVALDCLPHVHRWQKWADFANRRNFSSRGALTLRVTPDSTSISY